MAFGGGCSDHRGDAWQVEKSLQDRDGEPGDSDPQATDRTYLLTYGRPPMGGLAPRERVEALEARQADAFGKDAIY